MEELWWGTRNTSFICSRWFPLGRSIASSPYILCPLVSSATRVALSIVTGSIVPSTSSISASAATPAGKFPVYLESIVKSMLPAL